MKKTAIAVAVLLLAVSMVLPVVRSVNLTADGWPMPPYPPMLVADGWPMPPYPPMHVADGWPMPPYPPSVSQTLAVA